jgi:hypothetical protein
MEAVKNPGPVAVEQPSVRQTGVLQPDALQSDALQPGTEKAKKARLRWFWPASVIAASVTGAAVVMMRGCWHRKMSWPLSVQGSSYRVCLGCGIKRLFDEPTFTSYGPYSYDLNKLKAWDEARQAQGRPAAKRAS